VPPGLVVSVTSCSYAVTVAPLLARSTLVMPLLRYGYSLDPAKQQQNNNYDED